MSSTRNKNILINKYIIEFKKNFKLMNQEIDNLKSRVSYLENKLSNQSAISHNEHIVNDIKSELNDKMTEYMEPSETSNQNLIFSSDLKTNNSSSGFVKREINQSIQLDKEWLTKF